MNRVGTIVAVALIAHTANAQEVTMSPEDQKIEAEMGMGPEDTQEKVSIPADTPPVYTVREGDTLWDITEQFYGDPYRWPQVWSYNPEVTNPHWIYPGATIHLLPPDGQFVETAPRGFSYAKKRWKGDNPVYMAEYGFLDSDVLKEAGYIIAANEEHMMLSDTDQAYVRLKEDATPRIGGTYTVYREMQEFERVAGERGKLVRIIGEVLLTDYDRKRQVGRAGRWSTPSTAWSEASRSLRSNAGSTGSTWFPPRSRSVPELSQACTPASCLRPTRSSS